MKLSREATYREVIAWSIIIVACVILLVTPMGSTVPRSSHDLLLLALIMIGLTKTIFRTVPAISRSLRLVSWLMGAGYLFVNIPLWIQRVWGT